MAFDPNPKVPVRFQTILQHDMEESDQATNGRQGADPGAGGAGHHDVRPARRVVQQARRAQGEGRYRLQKALLGLNIITMY